ncbi:MAG: hypothetical protein Q9165_003906 [Trypethelium subeluteriae]
MSKSTWRALASKHGVAGVNVHDVKQPRSGSRLGLDQFLTFRAIYYWQPQSNFKTNVVHQFIGPEYLEHALKHLKSTLSWLKYIKAIEDVHQKKFQISEQDIGSYFSTLDWQNEALRKKKSSAQLSFQGKIDFSPIAKRTRSKQTAKALGSPSKAMKRLAGMVTSKLRLGETDEPSSQHKGLEASMSSPSRAQEPSQVYETPESMGPISPAQIEDMPIRNDEQIVNSALLTFLRCLTGYKRAPNAQWDMTRHRLTFENIPSSDTKGFKVYSADTDGLLRAEDGHTVLAIIEVKPYIRQHDRNSIRMQETAQMVAWIREAAQKQHDWKKIPRKIKLLVSQDNFEIYLTFAVSNKAYLDYVLWGAPSEDAFLHMHELGPWETTRSSHMEALSRIILAYTMQQEAAGGNHASG